MVYSLLFMVALPSQAAANSQAFRIKELQTKNHKPQTSILHPL